MPDFKKMYFTLSAKVADAIEFLQAAQQQGEEYLKESPPSLQIYPKEAKKEKD